MTVVTQRMNSEKSTTLKINGRRPKVSICIPVYNGERYISETVKSVISQTISDVEIIVQDNCSADGTWDVISEFAKNDTRVLIQRNDKTVAYG